MTKTKWHSKILSLSIVFALVFSLVAMVVPVTAQELVDLSVEVFPDGDQHCCSDTFNITANITNEDQVTAINVTADLAIEGNAEYVSGPWPASGSFNISAYSTTVVEFEVHCTGADLVTPTKFIVTADAANAAATAEGETTVTQSSGWLEATIIEPEDETVVPVNGEFDIVFYITNTGCNSVRSIWAEVKTIEGAEIIDGDTAMELDVYVGQLDAGESSANYTVRAVCTEVGPAILHVDPIGLDECSLKEIEGDSAVVEIEQVFSVTCNVTPNPTKTDISVNFTATVGEDAVLPLSYNWTFGDGGSADGTSSSYVISVMHLYETADNYTAHCSITDSSDPSVTVNCTSNITVVVYPELDVECMIREGTVAFETGRYMAKTDTTVCFNATRNGGLESPCYDGTDVVYSWFWDFGDGTNSTAQNPCHTYNVTGNYTATVTLTDDCLNNVATCNETIEIYDPLGIACNVTPTETKVGHDVDFDATIIGGLPSPPVAYSWYWDFGDGSGESGGPETNPDLSTTHQYLIDGMNTTAMITIWDGTAINNSATCNRTITVHPGLNVTCDVTPEVQRVCNAVNFSATRVGGVPGNSYNWTWEFSDNTTAVGQNVTKTFMCVGNYTGTVTVTDNDLGNTANCTATVEIIIEPPELYTPGNGVTVGSSVVDFTWEDIGCVNYTLEVWQKDQLELKVWLVETGKDAFWSGPIMDGNYKWQVTATDACGNTAVSELWYFGVQESGIAVTVTSPNGGEVMSANGTAAITWDAAFTDRYQGGFASSQDDLLAEIAYSADAGETWTTVATDEPNDGVYAWTVPMVNSDLCLVMVTVSDGAYNDGVDTSDAVFTIEMASTITTIDLAAGWNLVSLPLIPDDTDIATVMAGVSGNVTIVYWYDPSIDDFLWWSGGGTLTTMEDGKGYWILMATPGTFSFSGEVMPPPPAAPPTYDIVAGWNMIGLKSTSPVHHSHYLTNLAGDYSVLYAYDSGTAVWNNIYPVEQNGGMMEPGSGFWIYMTVDGIIVP